MLQTEQEIQVALKIKKLLDEGIMAGPWQANLFLKGIKKKLEEIRDDFVVRVGLEPHEQVINGLVANKCEMTEIYIALYQSQGSSMSKWQEVVVSLVNYTMGRPIYSNETDVQAAIRSNDRNLNHAYVVVTVHSDAILPDTSDLARTDREGRKLINLREAAIQLKNIIRLVHASGEYKLVGNFLVKQN